MIQETYRVAQHASVDEQCDFQLDAAKRPSALRRLLIDFFPGDEQEKKRKVKSKAWRRPPPLSVSERSLPARRRGSTVAKNLHPWMPRRFVVPGGRAHFSLLRSRAAPEKVHLTHPTARRQDPRYQVVSGKTDPGP